MAKKLLVADDSLTIQKVIRLALSNEGYEIQAVSDGNDAIQQISLFRPDAVLIDVSLPGKSAFEVKRAINEHSDLEEVRFILMSSAFEKVDESQADEVRFHGRLTKPFDPAHLRQVLSEALDQVAAMRREPTSLLQSPGDDWLPVQPNEPILSAPPPADEINQLWEHEEPTLVPRSTPPAPPPLMVPPPPPFAATLAPPPIPAAAPPTSMPTHETAPPRAGERDADIRHLTESTIRMSGLDDFAWSVNEPSLKPSAQLLDSGGTSFELDGAAEAPPIPETEEPSLKDIPMPTSEMLNAAAPSDFYRDPADSIKKTSRSEPNIVAVSPDQIEELLRKELQKLLPDLAEKIIKQEIHRMLSEPL